MLALAQYFRICLFISPSQLASLTIIPKYLHLSKAGISSFLNTKLGGLIFICFGLKHNENDLVALYDS